ncbi:MAG: hypothetical protein IEMM0001_1010 [bacterium]|nr:MAG: hypothetical protein IEMM0001_1010 [bacterium]
MKQQNNEPSFKDPVCGMKVSRTTAIDECRYQGMTYYFCAGICRRAFEAEPERYIPQHPHREQALISRVSAIQGSGY